MSKTKALCMPQRLTWVEAKFTLTIFPKLTQVQHSWRNTMPNWGYALTHLVTSPTESKSMRKGYLHILTNQLKFKDVYFWKTSISIYITLYFAESTQCHTEHCKKKKKKKFNTLESFLICLLVRRNKSVASIKNNCH